MMRFFTLLLFISLVGSMNAQVIWGGLDNPNSTFDGGPNDWVIDAISDENALWKWEADGRNALGAYSGQANAEAIISPSVDNGAMGFDSDFYDNDGTPGNFGNGISPAPQMGTLTSPIMDCTDQPAVMLSFFQYYRNFTGTVRTVNVSADGGENWTPFVLFSRAVNWGGERRDRVLLDISSVAANSAEVMIQFDYNTNYYYWLVDDVTLIVPPAKSMEITQVNLPVAARNVPAHMIASDTMEFAAQVINRGTEENMGGTFTAEIRDNSGAAVYTFTEDVEAMAVDDTILFVFDGIVAPEDNTLTEGAYSVVYSLETIEEDFDVFDNEIAVAFNATENLFQTTTTSAAYNFGAGTRPGISFRTGELADETGLRLDSIGIGGSANGDIVNAEASVYVFKVKNQLSDELDPVYAADNLGTPDDEHPNLEFVGFGFLSAPALANREETTIDLFNSEGSDFLFLEENTSYVVGVEWNEAVAFYNASDRLFHYQETNMVYTDANGWGFTQNISWVMPMQINLISLINSKETQLDEDVISVFPNPAKDFTNVNVDFEVPTSATILLTDALGNFITTKSVENALAETVTFDVSTLPAGTYNLQIRTSDNAVTTKSFIVID